MAGTFGKLRAAAIAANSITQDRFTSNLSSLISAGGGPKITSLQYSGGSDVGKFGGDTVTLNGSGFNSNANVYIGTNLANNINVVNTSILTFEAPAANVGNYKVYIKNEDGGSAIYLPGIDYGERYPQIQASVYGYISGGRNPSTDINDVEKFSFSSSYSLTDVGDLSQARVWSAGQSSISNGYASGGMKLVPPQTIYDTIDKFPFASDANATDVGNLSLARRSAASHSSSDNGYTSGGSPVTNIIDKFPFASDINATDVGDLTVARNSLAGISSIGMGFSGGGVPFGYPALNVIDRFPFASDANAVDSGDLTQSRDGLTSQNSLDNGYFSGGFLFPPNSTVNTIDKFPIASYGNATDVGDLTQHRHLSVGHSSTSDGYTSGGSQTWSPALPAPVFPGGNRDTVDKFPFATNSNAADVGDLTQPKYGMSGQQY
jgi:hypothetical protein